MADGGLQPQEGYEIVPGPGGIPNITPQPGHEVVAPPVSPSVAAGLKEFGVVDPSLVHGGAPQWSPTGEFAAPAPKVPVIDNPDQAASIGTTMFASLFPSDQKKVLAYAQERGISPSRYGIANGQIVYQNDQGQLVREVPSLGGATDIGDLARRAAHGAAAQVGPAIPATVGAVAGVMTAPVAGGVPGAAGAAGAADLVRQGIGNAFLKNAGIFDLDYGNAAGQAAMGGVGQLGGVALAAGGRGVFDANALKAAGFDSGKLMDPTQRAAWSQIANHAQDLGITLTPGNLTNARSLLVNERQLARLPDSMDQLIDMYLQRNTEQVPNAVRSTNTATLGGGSPIAPDVAARNLQAGAQATIQANRDARQAIAAPYYDAAYTKNQQVDSPVIDKILSTPAGKQALGDAATSMQNRMARLSVPDPELTEAYNDAVAQGQMRSDPNYQGGGIGKGLKLQTLDYVKQALDDQYEAATNQGVPTRQAGEILGLKQSLVKEMDRLDSTALTDKDGNIIQPGQYALGRAAYAAGSGGVTNVENGLVGLMASPRQFYQALPGMIARGDKTSISAARDAFYKAGQGPQWDQGVGAFLENTLRDAVSENASGGTGNVAGKFYKATFGDPTTKENLTAAIGDPAKVTAWNNLAEVLRSASRSLAEGSPTATDLNVGRLVSTPAKAVGTALKGVSLDVLPKLGEYIEDLSAGKNAGKLAALYTSPDAMAQLTRLNMMQPNGAAAYRLVGNLLAQGGFKSGAVAPGRADRPVGSLSSQAAQ